MNIGDPELSVQRLLAESSFGRIYICRSKRKNESKNVIVKRVSVQSPTVNMKKILDEVYIFSQLKHPRVALYLRTFVYLDSVNIVMEYTPKGTLRHLIEVIRTNQTKCAVSKITKGQLFQLFCDILMGLEYLHIRHVIHRNLKPDNLLLDACGRIKISDFGFSTIHVPSSANLRDLGNSCYYMAPESLMGSKFDFKSDIWSLGCIVYELCLGQNPFKSATSRLELNTTMRGPIKETAGYQLITNNFGSLWGFICENMLTYDARRRVSLPEIVRLDAQIMIRYYKLYFDYNYKTS